MNLVLGPQLRLVGADPDVPVLSVVNLRVGVPDGAELVEAVRGVSFQVAPGERVGLVGESGSGKTLCALSILGLLPSGGPRILAGTSIRLRSRELSGATEDELRGIRGAGAALVFQEASAVLNPVLRVGRQLGEVLALAGSANPDRAQRVRDLFAEVGFDDPERIASLFPHQLSAGMAQRVQLAMALAGDPELLIADEPTASLDSVGQRRVLELIADIQRRRGMALLLISHDLGMVGEFCQRVLVAYGGQIVEEGPVREVLRSPRHPYTRALLLARPDPDRPAAPRPIPGRPPKPSGTPDACLFADRCALATDRCGESLPELRSLAEAASGHRVRCWFPLGGPEEDSHG
jgi:oligopeptide/dipeptide ABC transporter ATP-binding protein